MTSFYSNILVPVDGTQEGINSSIKHAEEIAGNYDSTLMFLYVCKNEDGIEDGKIPSSCKNDVKATRSNADSLDEDTMVKVTEGNPVNEILKYSEKYDIDLIVMCTHGRTGVSRVLDGSVTEKVVRKSSKPVLAVDRND